MLPKSYRLNRSAITRVVRQGKSFSHGALLRLKVLKLPRGARRPVIAIVVSAKVATRAVLRNRIRRRVHGALAPMVRRITPHALVLFIQDRTVARMPFVTLSEELDTLFRRALLY
ncbi:MAG: ribonuclease P protein component [Parcubacteria group bacterium]|nr:ribonuclease P protein component [Parcubacteria group bacterium]